MRRGRASVKYNAGSKKQPSSSTTNLPLSLRHGQYSGHLTNYHGHHQTQAFYRQVELTGPKGFRRTVKLTDVVGLDISGRGSPVLAGVLHLFERELGTGHVRRLVTFRLYFPVGRLRSANESKVVLQRQRRVHLQPNQYEFVVRPDLVTLSIEVFAECLHRADHSLNQLLDCSLPLPINILPPPLESMEEPQKANEAPTSHKSTRSRRKSERDTPSFLVLSPGIFARLGCILRRVTEGLISPSAKFDKESSPLVTNENGLNFRNVNQNKSNSAVTYSKEYNSQVVTVNEQPIPSTTTENVANCQVVTVNEQPIPSTTTENLANSPSRTKRDPILQTGLSKPDPIETDIGQSSNAPVTTTFNESSISTTIELETLVDPSSSAKLDEQSLHNTAAAECTNVSSDHTNNINSLDNEISISSVTPTLSTAEKNVVLLENITSSPVDVECEIRILDKNGVHKTSCISTIINSISNDLQTTEFLSTVENQPKSTHDENQIIELINPFPCHNSEINVPTSFDSVDDVHPSLLLNNEINVAPACMEIKTDTKCGSPDVVNFSNEHNIHPSKSIEDTQQNSIEKVCIINDEELSLSLREEITSKNLERSSVEIVAKPVDVENSISLQQIANEETRDQQMADNDSKHQEQDIISPVVTPFSPSQPHPLYQPSSANWIGLQHGLKPGVRVVVVRRYSNECSGTYKSSEIKTFCRPRLRRSINKATNQLTVKWIHQEHSPCNGDRFSLNHSYSHISTFSDDTHSLADYSKEDSNNISKSSQLLPSNDLTASSQNGISNPSALGTSGSSTLRLSRRLCRTSSLLGRRRTAALNRHSKEYIVDAFDFDDDMEGSDERADDEDGSYRGSTSSRRGMGRGRKRGRKRKHFEGGVGNEVVKRSCDETDIASRNEEYDFEPGSTNHDVPKKERKRKSLLKALSAVSPQCNMTLHSNNNWHPQKRRVGRPRKLPQPMSSLTSSTSAMSSKPSNTVSTKPSNVIKIVNGGSPQVIMMRPKGGFGTTSASSTSSSTSMEHSLDSSTLWSIAKRRGRPRKRFHSYSSRETPLQPSPKMKRSEKSSSASASQVKVETDDVETKPSVKDTHSPIPFTEISDSKTKDLVKQLSPGALSKIEPTCKTVESVERINGICLKIKLDPVSGSGIKSELKLDNDPSQVSIKTEEDSKMVIDLSGVSTPEQKVNSYPELKTDQSLALNNGNSVITPGPVPSQVSLMPFWKIGFVRDESTLCRCKPSCILRSNCIWLPRYAGGYPSPPEDQPWVFNTVPRHPLLAIHAQYQPLPSALGPTSVIKTAPPLLKAAPTSTVLHPQLLTVMSDSGVPTQLPPPPPNMLLASQQSSLNTQQLSAFNHHPVSSQQSSFSWNNHAMSMALNNTTQSLPTSSNQNSLLQQQQHQSAAALFNQAVSSNGNSLIGYQFPGTSPTFTFALPSSVPSVVQSLSNSCTSQEQQQSYLLQNFIASQQMKESLVQAQQHQQFQQQLQQQQLRFLTGSNVASTSTLTNPMTGQGGFPPPPPGMTFPMGLTSLTMGPGGSIQQAGSVGVHFGGPQGVSQANNLPYGWSYGAV